MAKRLLGSLERRALSGLMFSMLLIVPVAAAPAAANPPEERGIRDVDFSVDCDGDGQDDLLRHDYGWFQWLSDDHLKAHFVVTYANDNGATWTYQDNGMARWFEKDGEWFMSLSGRGGATPSDLEGEGEWFVTWSGHIVIVNGELGDDQYQEGLMRVGTSQGNIDDLACAALT
jgi:hypothetical protein